MSKCNRETVLLSLHSLERTMDRYITAKKELIELMIEKTDDVDDEEV